jgi:hypothetical protein
MKPINIKPWSVDTKFRGHLNERTEGIVMDNVADRINPGRTKIKYFVTENIDLLAGNNTVAIFRIKKEEAIPAE